MDAFFRINSCLSILLATGLIASGCGKPRLGAPLQPSTAPLSLNLTSSSGLPAGTERSFISKPNIEQGAFPGGSFFVSPKSADHLVIVDPNVRSVAFVCDGSGSMMEKMEALKLGLNSAIGRLHPDQKFSVTLFQNEDTLFIDRNLIPATAANKAIAGNFVAGVSTSGSTDPLPALDIAYAQHPQMIYLLTDGDFPDNDSVLREVRKLDPGHKVRINVFAFFADADDEASPITVLSKIARGSGGKMKIVHLDEYEN